MTEARIEVGVDDDKVQIIHSDQEGDPEEEGEPE